MENRKAAAYSAVTLLCTFIIGEILLRAFPDGTDIWASVLFILMNLTPMIVAGFFCGASTVGDFFKSVFFQKEKWVAWVLALLVPIAYYGISVLLNNVQFTGAAVVSVLAYFPWTLLQGGLEEVGWRWYLQKNLKIKSFELKMLIISAVWFLWHIPIYRIPWITAGSSDYLIFYLMILGNTFTLGAVKAQSKGTVPCILAHMLIDSLAVVMLVQSSFPKIAILVLVEIALSLLSVRLIENRLISTL